MNIQMKDEWRNKSEKDVWNEYLPSDVTTIETNDEYRTDYKGSNDWLSKEWLLPRAVKILTSYYNE